MIHIILECLLTDNDKKKMGVYRKLGGESKKRKIKKIEVHQNNNNKDKN